VVAVCFFAIRNTAPPLTTCGDQNLRAKNKRSGTQPDNLIAKTPRTLLAFTTRTLPKPAGMLIRSSEDVANLQQTPLG